MSHPASEAEPRQTSTTMRCVVWHRPDSQIPLELVKALSRRAVDLTSSTNVFDALARACLMSRQVDPGSAATLVLVEPAGRADAAELFDAVQRYAPDVACWRFSAADGQPLRAMRPEDALAASENRAKMPPAPVSAPATTPLTGSPRRTPIPAHIVRDVARSPMLKLVGTPPAFPAVSGPPAVSTPTFSGVPLDPRPLSADGPSGTSGSGGVGRDAKNSESSEPSPAQIRTILSEEELEMLLADDEPRT